MRIGRVTAVAALVVVSIASAIPSAGAEPGDADSTFGSCGVKVWPRPISPSSGPRATLAQADGKILQVGQNDDRSIHVTRLVPSGGGIDRSYGTNGTARVAVPSFGWMSGSAVAAGDKLVLVGSGPSTGRGAAVLIRLTASGAIDSGFGSGQVVTTDLHYPGGVLVQPDDRVILWSSWSPPYLRRYNAGGGANPAWTPQLPPDAHGINAAGLAADGDLIAAAQVGAGTRLFRFQPNGSTAPGFTASFVFPGADAQQNSFFRVSQVIELPDGKILVVGGLTVSQPNLEYRSFVGVARLDATGQVDPTYGIGGFTTAEVTWIPFEPIARVDGQGRLVTAGSYGIDPSVLSLGLSRFTPTGTPDPTFGNAGTSTMVAPFAQVQGLVIRGRWILVGNGIFNRLDNTSIVRVRTDSTKLGAGFLLNSDGGLHPFRVNPADSPPPCPTDGPQLRGLARAVTTVTNRGGLVLDGYGGLHRFSAGVRKAPAQPLGAPYWPGWDIARGVAALPNGKGGYVLDGFGGIHRYRTGANPLPPAIAGAPYWPGWDIARGIALLPNGKGGYVLDGLGGIHPFAVGSNPMPPPTTGVLPPVADSYRGIAIRSDGTGGYVTVRGGGYTTFAIGGHEQPPSFCPCPPIPRAGDVAGFRSATFVAPRAGVG